MTQTQVERAGSTPKHYRNVPVVDLLPRERGSAGRVLAALRVQLALRVLLVATVVVVGAFAGIAAQRSQGNARELLTARAATTRAQVIVQQAAELQEAIDALTVAAAVPALDYAFLTNQEGDIPEVVRSVLGAEVDGITVREINTVGPNEVGIIFAADTHDAALEWRRLIIASAGVSSVSRFDSSTDGETIIYDAVVTPVSESG